MNVFLQFLQGLLAQAPNVYNNRNTPADWDASIVDGPTTTTFVPTNVSLELTSIEFDFTYQGVAYQMVGIPGTTEYAVKVNGVADPAARVVYRPVPSFANPFRFHLDFTGVTLGSRTVRVNLAYPNKAP